MRRTSTTSLPRIGTLVLTLSFLTACGSAAGLRAEDHPLTIEDRVERFCAAPTDEQTTILREADAENLLARARVAGVLDDIASIAPGEVRDEVHLLASTYRQHVSGSTPSPQEIVALAEAAERLEDWRSVNCEDDAGAGLLV